jgi:hypothetical protein
MSRRWAGAALVAVLLAIVVPLALAGQRGGSADASDAGSGQAALHVIPFPDTPDASSQSQIIFTSLKPSDLSGRPTVTGSSSGRHGGRVAELPDNSGTVFVPNHPFTPGETVTVHAGLRSAQAGTRSGAPGSRSLSWSFTIGVAPPSKASAGAAGAPYQPAGVPAPTASAAGRPSAVSAGRGRNAPHQVFKSEPHLRPAALHVSAEPAPGDKDIFVTPLPGHYRGLMILNPRGQLLWFHPVHHGLGSLLAVQRYLGHRVITYGTGKPVHGHDRGVDFIMNSSYQIIAKVHAGWGYQADLHEFQLIPHGIAVIDAYVPVRADLSSVGGPTNGVVLDCVIQKIDVKTGKVLWEWHALGHVPLSDSYTKAPQNADYDFFHLNSIQQLPGDKLLISARATWGVYLINERTGKVIWTLGGKDSTFNVAKPAAFEWQHDVRLLPHNLLSVFDDADFPQEEPQSSAKLLRLNTSTHTASLVHRYTHTPPILTSYEGSAQLLPNHDMVVGWGTASAFSEYKPGGRQVFNATFAMPVNTYRAYRFSWVGHPRGKPSVATRRSHGTTWVYVSWNGATRVASWRVLAGSSSQSLAPVASRRWSGFETAIPVHSHVSYVAVQAVDSGGHVLGVSRTTAVGGG